MAVYAGAETNGNEDSMSQPLQELRRQIAAIDREIVAALAERSRHPFQPSPASDASTEPRDTDLISRILEHYESRVARALASEAGGPHDPVACSIADRAVIAAILRRLRVVLEIARVKENNQRAHFRALIASRDSAALETAITQPAVETQVVARAAQHAAEQTAPGLPADLPDRVAMVYLDCIIPLARQVQVDALLGT